MNRPFYKTIRGRLVVTVLVLILFTVFAISSVSYLLLYRNLRQAAIHSAETNLHLLAENINLYLADITDFIQRCQANDQIRQFLMTPRENDRYSAVAGRASELLNNDYLINSSQKYIQRLLIAGFDRSDYVQVVQPTYSVDKPLPELIQKLPYFQESLESTRLSEYPFRVTEEPFTPRSDQIVPIVRPIQSPYSSGNIGFVFAAVSLDLFTDNMNSYIREKESSLYLTIGEEIFLLDGAEAVPADFPETDRGASSFDRLREDTQIYRLKSAAGHGFCISCPLSLNGCQIAQVIPMSTFRRQFSQYLYLLLLIFTAVAAVGLCLFAALSRSLTRPIKKLRDRISIIAGGDFTQDNSILWNNELGDMGRDINQLSRDISGLIDRRVAYEKEKMDYEYRLLQSQVNPHFLYNTLNSIKWMATIQNAPGIAEMTLALSRLLKNISKGSSAFVSIRQEFDLLNDYFSIQKYRYGGMITLEYEINSDALLDNEILRFTLQPIVENAIFHGIEPSGHAGVIRVRLYQPQADLVRIDITDNGLGIEQEKLAALLTEEAPNKDSFFRNVGVSNVHKRLQLTYGERFGLQIQSEIGVYTTVSTLLPVKPAKEGETL